MLVNVITFATIENTNGACALYELRLDYWQEIDLARVANFINTATLPVILTLRPVSQGGRYQGSEASRITLLRQLITLSPAYLDIEHSVENPVIDELHAINPSVKLIRSYHNFKETPANLSEILTQLRHPAIAIYKIATFANSTLDSLRILAFAQQHQNLVALCMGEYGSCTRILAPVVGSCWTYVAQDEQQSIAPGMLTYDEMVNIYRYPQLNQQTKIFALIGDPVAQSDGHYFHNEVYRQQNRNAVYVKFKVAKHELTEFFALLKSLPVNGLSVTMPLKECVLPFVDHCDELVQHIGATNTLKFINNKIFATNTDVVGVLQPLEQHIPLQGKKALVIGAGGAAKAVIYALINAGARVAITNRTQEKAQQLATQFKARVIDHQTTDHFDLVINTLPDLPQTKDFLTAIVNHVMDDSTLVMDIVYKPKETSFIKQSKSRTTKIIYGEAMFITQAAAQAKIYEQE